MRITGIYAAIATLILLALALRVSLGRKAGKVDLGDGGHPDLSRRIRAHANAVEYVPLALLLMLILELNQTQPLWLHVFGIVLVIGRIAHAIGISQASGVGPGRIVGTLLTWTVMLVMALLLLWQWLVLASLPH